jgi:hypothetical protein
MTIPKIPSASTLPIPVRYEPSMETIDEDEAKTIQGLIETTERIQAIVAADVGRAKRGVHAKAHGLLVGELEILPDLSAVLAQGLFATPQTYPAVLRLSTIPGDLLDDAVCVPRAASLKVVGVSGPRVPGSERDVTQDFLFLNGKGRSAPPTQTPFSALSSSSRPRPTRRLA